LCGTRNASKSSVKIDQALGAGGAASLIIVLVTIVGLIGAYSHLLNYAWSTIGELSKTAHIWPISAGVMLLNAELDWAVHFVGIRGEDFESKYHASAARERATGRYHSSVSSFQFASALFCAIGTMLMLVTVVMTRPNQHSSSLVGTNKLFAMVVVLMAMEILPQLVINAVYMEAMADDGGPEGVAPFSLTVSILAILSCIVQLHRFDFWTVKSEVWARKEEAQIGVNVAADGKSRTPYSTGNTYTAESLDQMVRVRVSEALLELAGGGMSKMIPKAGLSSVDDYLDHAGRAQAPPNMGSVAC
jgi:hypothetical protein